ncbi:DUF3558 family protein [Nocardia sp. NPDC003345]
MRSPGRHRRTPFPIRPALVVLAAVLAATGCETGESTGPAAGWDPCGLPADLITEAGFLPGSGRSDVAAEQGWTGCGWSSADAALRVWFADEGSPGEIAGAQDTRTDLAIGDRTGTRLSPGAVATAPICTIVLPTAAGGIVRVRVDSSPAGSGPGACARAERTVTALASALPR